MSVGYAFVLFECGGCECPALRTQVHMRIQEYTCVPRNTVTCPAELGSPSPLPVTPFSRQHVSIAVMPEDLLPGSTELLSLHS